MKAINRKWRICCLLVLITLGITSAKAQAPAAKTVNINFKSVPVATVLNAIQKQTDLNFVYSSTLAATWPKVTVRSSKKPAEEVIKEITSIIGCTYSIKNNIVTITQQKLSGKERTIKGHVRDADGELLVGVPICIGETRVCTVTDADGFYTFKIPVEQTTLKYSYVGMETAYVTIPRGTNDITREITMHPDVMLDEVLVTGY